MKHLGLLTVGMSRPNSRNSLHFSLLAGDFRAEKGSLVTASSASRFKFIPHKHLLFESVKRFTSSATI